jgi:hypothetical protein
LRSVQLTAFVAGLVLLAPSGECAKAKKRVAKAKGKPAAACVSSYKRGIKLQDAGKLIDARKAMVMCAQQTRCAAAVRKECKLRYTQLRDEIPSVIPSVTDEKGAPVTDVEVTMDGTLLTAEIDGRAVEINPGVHEFSFASSKGLIAKQKLEISPRQRNRPITISLSPKSAKSPPVAAAPAPTPPAPAAPPEPSQAALEASAAPSQAAPSDEPPIIKSRQTEREEKSGRGVAPYLIGGLGLVGVGGYGLLTYWGRKDNEALDECAPNCPTTDIDHIRKMYLAADISLGIGVVALATSTWLFLRSGSSSSEEVASSSSAPRRPKMVLDVKPAPSGAFATVSGAF